MIFIAKLIGLICVVGVPTSIGGIQLYLKNKTISTSRTEVQNEIKKTAESLNKTKENFNKEIARITTEKNELAVTKNELTYVPVEIKDKISALESEKSNYETKHTETQEAISALVTAHEKNVETKKTEIEGLWTNEKARVEKLKTELDKKIQEAKTANEKLQLEIDTAKASIEKTINDVFSPPTP